MLYNVFQLNARDGRPACLCYVCHALLRRCRRFADMARRADASLHAVLAQHHKVLVPLPLPLPLHHTSINNSNYIIFYYNQCSYHFRFLPFSCIVNG